MTTRHFRSSWWTNTPRLNARLLLGIHTTRVDCGGRAGKYRTDRRQQRSPERERARKRAARRSINARATPTTHRADSTASDTQLLSRVLSRNGGWAAVCELWSFHNGRGGDWSNDMLQPPPHFFLLPPLFEFLVCRAYSVQLRSTSLSLWETRVQARGNCKQR